MKNYEYSVNVRPGWIEQFNDLDIARSFALTYGAKVKTNIQDWQVNTAIVITLIVLVVLSIIFTS